MRIVADTNIVVSGLLFGGLPLRVLDAGKTGIVELCTSPALLTEFTEVIERPQFDRKFAETGISRHRMVSDYAEISTVISPTKLSGQVTRDRDDDEVIACALAADCEFIVTGDNDLLVLKEHRGIKIAAAAEFLRELEL
ncbi:MAG: putative toxin-antitoxin system toxin component, PIN family [Acidobacteria bacterium]|nr:putative toxin-antitoxin system toxin component, PIN family [Acidobacteriota bacterium]